MNDLSGKSLGRYHIIEKLGEGGMAVVYKTYDTRLERDVAVKVIRTEQLAPAILERALKRFEREAKAVAKLSHPNIVKVIDYGEYEDQPYLVMEYIPGGTLNRLLKEKGRLPWQDAAKITIKVADALEYAHKEKIIHRDIKPSNILLTADYKPILTDFGVAKVLNVETTQDLTGTSASVGTPEYMAPEQVTSKMVDRRADIYALGIVFYEMVTGRKPYNADTPLAVLFKHISDPLPRPRDFVENLPEDVERIIYTALAKKPEDRYQSMEIFSKALKGLLDFAVSEKRESGKTRTKVNHYKLTHQINEEEVDTHSEGKNETNITDQITEPRKVHREKKNKLSYGVLIFVGMVVVIGTIAFLSGFITSIGQLFSLRSNKTVTQTATLTIFPSPKPKFTITPTQETTKESRYSYDAKITDNANCRSGPGTVYPVIQNLIKGDEVTVIAHNPNNDWYYVLENSNDGCWILSSLITFIKEESPASDLQLFTPIPTPVITKVVNIPKISIISEQKTRIWLISYEVSNLTPNSPITIIWFEGLIDGDRNYINTRGHNYFFLTSDNSGVCKGQFNIQSGEYTFKVIDQSNSSITIDHFIVN